MKGKVLSAFYFMNDCLIFLLERGFFADFMSVRNMLV